jgi:hypothetical protein
MCTTHARQATQIRHNRENSGYTRHRKKIPLLNTWEHFHIHSLSAQKLQMSDKYTDIHNKIFDVIIKYISHNNKSLTNSPPTTT